MTDTLHDTDADLLGQVASGDEGAFTLLFARYRERLFFYLLRHVKSREAAEEIVTDIFMKLWTGRELTAHIRHLGAFLHKVAFHEALHFLRTAARHARLSQVYIDRGVTAVPRTPAELVIDAETRRILHEAIEQLPPQRKKIYRLSRQEGLSHEQIAEALGLSRATVNNALVAAHRSISQHLQQKGIGKAALSLFFLLG
jgi:RNA polymerase sigma-70 factor (ECF subfamily)